MKPENGRKVDGNWKLRNKNIGIEMWKLIGTGKCWKSIGGNWIIKILLA